MSHKSIEIRYNRAIDGSDHMQTTSELSASERIFTTAQVKRLGVPRNALAKVCAAGRLLRVMHGAYRMAGVPSAETDELEAIWKLTAPSLFTHERVQPSAWDGIAAGGTAAASIHGIGDFYLSPYVLIAPKRVRSRFSGVTFPPASSSAMMSSSRMVCPSRGSSGRSSTSRFSARIPRS